MFYLIKNIMSKKFIFVITTFLLVISLGSVYWNSWLFFDIFSKAQQYKYSDSMNEVMSEDIYNDYSGDDYYSYMYEPSTEDEELLEKVNSRLGNIIKSKSSKEEMLEYIDIILNRLMTLEQTYTKSYKLNSTKNSCDEKCKERMKEKYYRIMFFVNWMSDQLSSYSLTISYTKWDIVFFDDSDVFDYLEELEDVSESEKKLIGEKLISMQNNLKKLAKENIKKYEKLFEKYLYYKETWSSSVDFSLNWWMMWKVDANLELKDYTIINNLIQTLIETTYDWKFSNNMMWIKNDIDSSWEVTYMNNIEEIFLKISNFEINWTTSLDELIEKAKLVEVINQFDWYVKLITSKNEWFNTFLTVMNKIYSDEEFEKSFFDVFNIKWNRYYLLPKKEFCDFFMWKCSEEDYNKLVVSYIKWWDWLYYEMSDDEHFWIEEITSSVEGKFRIYNSEKDISKIMFSEKSIDDEESVMYWSSRNIGFVFENKKSLDINIINKDSYNDVEFVFESELDWSNRFKSIDSNMLNKAVSWDNWDYEKIMEWELTLKNNKFEWDLEYNHYDYRYSYNLEDNYWSSYTKWPKFTIKVNWETDSSNKLSKINWDVNLSQDDDELFKWSLVYTKNSLDLDFETDMQWKWSFVVNLSYKKQGSYINDLDLEMNLDMWQSWWFDWSMILKNKELNWEYKAVYNWEDIVSIDFDWTYDNWDLAFEWTYNIGASILWNSMMMPWMNLDEVWWDFSVKSLVEWNSKDYEVAFSLESSLASLNFETNWNLIREYWKFDINFPEKYTLFWYLVWDSMLPNYKSNDAYTLSEDTDSIKRWDVVVFDPPSYYSDWLYIKRIIWMPWETVKIEWWDVYICEDDECEVLDEPYLEEWTETIVGSWYYWYENTDSSNEFELWDDEFFVMWDNREYSRDSRVCFSYSCYWDSWYWVLRSSIVWVVKELLKIEEVELEDFTSIESKKWWFDLF